MQALPGYQTQYQILKPGSGKAITAGCTATVHATGVVKQTGKKFWSTKDPGQSPFSYEAGRGKVITGWDQGCLGMVIGEERKLVIPAEEGYGAGGFPAWDIPPGATLEFTLECLEEFIDHLRAKNFPKASGGTSSVRKKTPAEKDASSRGRKGRETLPIKECECVVVKL